MRPLPVEPPAFFHRGPSPLARLAFFALISLALLFADTRYRYLEQIRQAAAVVVHPLQRAALLPGEAIDYITEYFSSQRALTARNEELQRQLVEQAPLIQGDKQRQADLAQLQALLELRQRFEPAATAVEVLYSGRDPFSQKIVVNKGSNAGILPGQAVIDVDGVVGQVTRVFPFMAEVTLVSDKDQAVPVKVVRNGLRSVLYGSGAGSLPELRFIAPSADIEVGDRLVTSGIDGTYPPGLAVAEIATLERDAGRMFAKIGARPLAGIDRSSFLLVLSPVAALPPRPDEPAETGSAKRPGRGKGSRGG